MQKLLFTFIILLESTLGLAQADADTVVVTDFTNAMVFAEADGKLQPIVDLSAHVSSGVFLDNKIEGIIRVCNPSPISVWLNGKFFKRIEQGCEMLDIKELIAFAGEGRFFVNIHARDNLAQLRFEEITIRQSLVLAEQENLNRPVRDYFREFTITGLIFILLMVNILAFSRSSRINYVLRRTFSFKTSSYELVNTQFISVVGLSFCLLASIIIGFFWSYLVLGNLPEELANRMTYEAFIFKWLRASGIIFSLFIIKWILALLFGSLFDFKRISEFQLFDFVNICLIFSGLLLTILCFDFIFNLTVSAWMDKKIIAIILIILGSFIIYFGWKFVNNSPDKKLLIISYLCATEIMPAILLIGWFFK